MYAGFKLNAQRFPSVSRMPFRCSRVLEEKGRSFRVPGQGLSERDAMIDYPRFTGVFYRETGTYGFLKEVKGINGQPPDDLPIIDGKPGGVFLAGQVAKETLGGSPKLLDAIDGERLNFAIRPSAYPKHYGRVEAYNVRRIDQQVI